MERLTSAEKKQLRGHAQRLKPAIRIGRHGLSANVFQEIETTLDKNELIKIRFDGSRQEILNWIEQVAGRTGAECIGSVGKTATFFRSHSKLDSES